MIYKTKLKNGLSIIIEQDLTLKTCTMKYVVRAGALDEINFPYGIAHLSEHMLFQGTKKRTAEQINTEIVANGGYNNASVDYSSTNLFISCLSDKWKENLNILNDMFWFSLIKKDSLEKEKAVVTEEIRMYNDRPDSKVMDQIEWTMNETCLNRRSNVGTVDSVQNISIKDINKWRSTFYVPNNVALIVAGNVPINELINEVSYFTKDLSSSLLISKLEEYKSENMNSQVIHSYMPNLSQSHLAFYIKGVPPYHEDKFKQELLIEILGKNVTSRLFKIIRDKLGLAYDINVYSSNYRDTSYIVGYTITDDKNIKQVRRIITQQLNYLRHISVEDDELEIAKMSFLSSLLLSRESTEVRTFLHENNFIFGTDYTIEDIINKINSISARDLMKFARLHFIKENIIWSLINSKGEKNG